MDELTHEQDLNELFNQSILDPSTSSQIGRLSISHSADADSTANSTETSFATEDPTKKAALAADMRSSN